MSGAEIGQNWVFIEASLTSGARTALSLSQIWQRDWGCKSKWKGRQAGLLGVVKMCFKKSWAASFKSREVQRALSFTCYQTKSHEIILDAKEKGLRWLLFVFQQW